jgi:hypothetical protein
VQNNNNIVWKNITVVDEVPGTGRFASFIVANFTEEMQETILEFLVPKGEELSIFDWGQLFVELTPALMKQLDREKEVPDGVRILDDVSFRILKPRVRLGHFRLSPNEMHAMKVRFVPNQQQPLGVRVLTLDIVQRFKNQVIGGVRFVMKTIPDTRNIAVDNPAYIFDGVTWVPAAGTTGCQCC